MLVVKGWTLCKRRFSRHGPPLYVPRFPRGQPFDFGTRDPGPVRCVAWSLGTNWEPPELTTQGLRRTSAVKEARPMGLEEVPILAYTIFSLTLETTPMYSNVFISIYIYICHIYII